ncbi:hypothetical protein ABZ468_46080 [Streptomyces sp. NPDC005708]|uniref:hypothetical protein n=1 Tax=Streptomyces sp. NPDC005708 TaxID=3154564 RepID=UPI0033D231F1
MISLPAQDTGPGAAVVVPPCSDVSVLGVEKDVPGDEVGGQIFGKTSRPGLGG